MQILEPTTMITDYVLAIVAVLLGSSLWRIGQNNNENSVSLWAVSFFTLAFGAFVGGTSHGFALYLNDFSDMLIWKATVFSIGFGSLLMIAGTILGTLSKPARVWALGLVIAKFAVYAFWMLENDDFMYVVYNYVPDMVSVIALALFAIIKRKDPSGFWIIPGVLISFFAAYIQQSGFSLAANFNHNDLFHTIQLIALYPLFKGASLLQDQSM